MVQMVRRQAWHIHKIRRDHLWRLIEQPARQIRPFFYAEPNFFLPRAGGVLQNFENFRLLDLFKGFFSDFYGQPEVFLFYAIDHPHDVNFEHH